MIRKIGLAFACLIFSANAFATDFGISYTNFVINKDPDDTNAYRTAIFYQPESLNWSNFNIYFDTGYTHLWIDEHIPYRSISIYSVAPYFRYYFKKTTEFSPYIEASIGLAYMTKTQLGCRNLGMHFTFQDILGVGVAIGKKQQFFASAGTIHYSNASFSNHNSGITAPVFLTVGYRF